jgi:hypothetical protein
MIHLKKKKTDHKKHYKSSRKISHIDIQDFDLCEFLFNPEIRR